MAQLADEVKSLPAVSRRQVQQRMRAYVAFVHGIVDELAAAGRLRAIDTYMVFGAILWVPRWFREGGRLTATQVAYEVAWSTVDSLLRRTGPKLKREIKN